MTATIHQSRTAREPSGSQKSLFDTPLIERAAEGDRAAREQLAAACLPRVRRIVGIGYGPKDDMDDVVQIAMVTVFRDLSQLRSAAGFRAWIDTVVWNVIRSHGRRRSRFASLFIPAEQEIVEAHTRPMEEGAIIHRELFFRLHRHLSGIGEKKRMAAVLSLCFGYVDSEIADLMGCSVEAAKKRTQHGRRELFERLRRDPAYVDLLAEVMP